MRNAVRNLRLEHGWTQVQFAEALGVSRQIAAAGTPEALIRQYSATSTVAFTIPTHPTVDLTTINLPGDTATAQTRNGTRVTVVTTDPDAVLRRLTFTPGLRATDYTVNTAHWRTCL